MERLTFKCNDKKIESGKETILCGIINVTPDSFSDGGKYYGVELAVNRAKELIAEGATMLDIGGESTRPGSTYVEIEEEINRVVPVIREIKKITDIPISIDTWKSEVAKAAIDAGADIVNDITGFLGDKNMVKVVSNSKAGAILMFNPVIARPEHEGSKIFPKFGAQGVFDKKEYEEFNSLPIEELMFKYFEKGLNLAKENNISKDRIMLDPGIGFGLTKRENFILINKIDMIKERGYFTFLGVSRKRFITNILSENGFEIDESQTGQRNKDDASAKLTAIASFKGVEVLRVHTIKPHLMAAKIADCVRLANQMEDINFKAYKR
ncbi:MAG: dihydropteroate synthase [Peptoniphilaceae bacterium]|uniref:dihydropteroate synthase n=2 Tax=Parvimonas sp. TaxID=1944660 RepID=UPI002A75E21E|nr:dihydropteroate synthase [Parvimonas sp.]MDD7765488.1 dihydropteroate synthase [Peptoniphilaceae bacterium]MDY3051029.1 dihydropteroate synthase [Parvimonas sp.]